MSEARLSGEYVATKTSLTRHWCARTAKHRMRGTIKRRESTCQYVQARTTWTGGLQDGPASRTSSAVESRPSTSLSLTARPTRPRADQSRRADRRGARRVFLDGALRRDCGGGRNAQVARRDGRRSSRTRPRGRISDRRHALTCAVRSTGLDEAGFVAAAEGAKAGCPVSKALTGTTITLDAGLA